MTELVPRPDAIPEGENKLFVLCRIPINVKEALWELRTKRPQHAEMFTVTAGGDASTPKGLSPLCACASQQATKSGEPHYDNYCALLRQIVLNASQCGMLDHMSGSKGYTALMKASAAGNVMLVNMLLAKGARDPHLGFIIPPFQSGSFYSYPPRKGF